MNRNPPEQIRDICQAFVSGLLSILQEKLHSVIIYGAAAFPDVFPISDIDYHVILSEALTEREKSDLNNMHLSIEKAFPPLGSAMDGYYILLKSARELEPPKSQMWLEATDSSWALHREHIRAGRCIVLFGPDPRGIYPSATWAELEDALWGELIFVEKNLSKYPAYCILNLCRLVYSFETKDVVVSKAAAAAWASEAIPEWRACIDMAIRFYTGQATTRDLENMLSVLEEFYRFASRRISKGS